MTDIAFINTATIQGVEWARINAYGDLVFLDMGQCEASPCQRQYAFHAPRRNIGSSIQW